jgi:hypothetical protein
MKQANNPEWKHTYGRSKEPQRLRAEVLSRDRQQRVDEKLRVFEGSPIESMSMEDMITQTSTTVSPGTYFEMRRCVSFPPVFESN